MILPARLEAKIIPEPNSGCWIWLGALHKFGYGKTWDSVQRRPREAYRVIYELLKGPVPKGFELDHICRVPACVNPDHLEPVTHRDNMRRGNTGLHEKIKTHCPQGHPYDEANTYYRPGSTYRECRRCRYFYNKKARR